MIFQQGLKEAATILRSTDAFFFDIDGTLLVTRDLVHWNVLHQAMLQVFDVGTNIHGLAHHRKTDISILRMALQRKGIGEQEFLKGLPRALEVVCREVSQHAHGLKPYVCPSIPELLTQIRDQARMLAVASGNLEVVGWHKISAAGPRPFFGSGAFGLEERSTKSLVLTMKTAPPSGSNRKALVIEVLPAQMHHSTISPSARNFPIVTLTRSPRFTGAPRLENAIQ